MIEISLALNGFSLTFNLRPTSRVGGGVVVGRGGGGLAYEWEDLISAEQIMVGHLHTRSRHFTTSIRIHSFFYIYLNLVIMEKKNSYDVRTKSVFASKQERVCACQTFIIFAERNLAAIPAKRELIAVGSRGCTHTPCYVPVPIRQHHHDIQ